MRLRDYLQLIRERILLVLLITVVVAAADLAITLSSPPSYQAGTRIRLVINTNGASGSGNVIQQAVGDIATEAQLVTSTAVAQRVRQDLHLQTPAPDLINSVSVSGVGGAQEVLDIGAGATTPGQAVLLANGFANAYLEVRSAQLLQAVDQATQNVSSQLKTVLAALQSEDAQLTQIPSTSPQYSTVAAERDSSNGELVALQGELQALAAQRVGAEGFGQIVQAATAASVVRSRALDRTILFGVLIGLPLGIAVVLLLDSFRNVVRRRGEIEQQAGVDVLGVVPFDIGWLDADAPRLVTESEPLSPVAEAYRVLAVTIHRAMSAAGARRLLITSAGPAEGRTATATNLAFALAESGHPIVFIEADIRRPKAYEALGGDYVPGLAELLRGEVGATEVIQRLRPNLRYVGPGVVTDRADLLYAGADFQEVLDEIAATVAQERAVYPSVTRLGAPPSELPDSGAGATDEDSVYVLIDAGSVLEAPEAVLVAGVVNGVFLVARPSVSTRAGVTRAAEQLRHAGGNLMGAILVGSRNPEDLGIAPAGSGMSGWLAGFLGRRQAS